MWITHIWTKPLASWTLLDIGGVLLTVPIIIVLLCLLLSIPFVIVEEWKQGLRARRSKQRDLWVPPPPDSRTHAEREDID